MVHAPVVRSVVVSWLGSDVAPVASGTRSPVSYHSTPVEVNHPHVDHALSSVPGGHDHCKQEFDDVLVRFYGYPGNGRQLFPPHASLYNKYVGGKPHEGLDFFNL